MAGIKQHSGLVVPLDAANVDTDAIIPKQFLQAITRVGFTNGAIYMRQKPSQIQILCSIFHNIKARLFY